MLVVTCKVGEVVHIGDDVIVMVTSVERGRVRIGITAPPDVKILRGINWDKIHEEER